MNSHHPSLASGRWRSFPLSEQLAHVGSEVERALRWRSKGRPEYAQRALERGLELLDLTLNDPKHRGRLRELARLREALLDYFLGENVFGSSEDSWRRYFHCFAYAARSSSS
ncbi:MAG: hypothetical protein KAT18_01665 [Candidatus Latescibacteria bacterium]|nr:hypothetical protein [Candidatus Latescibacterota bacterium]